MSTACFFGRMLNEEALLKIGELGVKYAEVFFSAQMEYTDEFTGGLAATCKEFGIKMVSVHALPTQFEPQLFSRHPRQYKEAMEVYKKVLRAAKALGAEKYVFHGPIHLKIARKPSVDMGFAADRATELAEIAKLCGVKLCYENVHWCWYNMPGFASELVARAQTDNLYFTLDMKQAAQSGFPVTDYIDDMGSRLAHVHLCDHRVDAERGIMPCLPFEGEADWAGMRAALSAAHFSGTMMLEVYSSNYKDFEMLKNCYESVAEYFGTELIK